MDKNISFHDFYVIGLLHDRDQDNLFIQTESETGNKVLLEFSLVAGWDLSPFNEQNSLFDFHEFDKKSLPDWIKTDFNVPKEYLEQIDSGEKKLFYLDPSAGLGGYIVASGVAQKTSSELVIKSFSHFNHQSIDKK